MCERRWNTLAASLKTGGSFHAPAADWAEYMLGAPARDNTHLLSHNQLWPAIRHPYDEHMGR